jgi:hypothetical protein
VYCFILPKNLGVFLEYVANARDSWFLIKGMPSEIELVHFDNRLNHMNATSKLQGYCLLLT